jgi:tRNA(fMet)-specific endonuclease VapC
MSGAVATASLLVNTDIVSFFFKGDSRRELYRSHLAGKFVVVFFMTVAELDRWALERNWGAARRARLERHLAGYPLYPFNRALC